MNLKRVYNYAKDLLPKSFNNFFTMRSEVHNYHTRNKSHYIIAIQKTRRLFSDKTIRTIGPILWNSLEDKITKCEFN